jgi:hypothetical protein
MISQFLLFIAYCVLIIAMMMITNSNAQESELVYDKFDGTIGDTSSWFDASRWTDILSIPTNEHTVWIDESNTYVAIDSTFEIAEVFELVIGRSGSSSSIESVQVDLLENASLQVTTNLIIGELLESDGTLYASHNSQINVGETLTIGDAGSGIVVLSGSAKITANDIDICENSVENCILIMDNESQLHLNGNKKDKLTLMINTGLIVSSLSHKEGLNKAFEVTHNTIDGIDATTVKIITVTKAPTIAPTKPPTNAPVVLPTKPPPTKPPTKAPVIAPTKPPTKSPTKAPVVAPTKPPTKQPTNAPVVAPTKPPTKQPTNAPVVPPTDAPTDGFLNVSTEAPTKSPTKAPEVEEVCQDTNFKFKNIKKKNCQWAAKKNKCNKKYKSKSIGDFWCKSSCGKCPTTSDFNTGGCVDSTTLKFGNSKKKNCKWVGKGSNKKIKKKCKKTWKGQKLADICPQSCGVTKCN